MQRRIALGAIALSAAGIGAIALAADLPARIAPPPTFHSDMNMLTEAGTPGPPHRFLDFFVGEWDAAVTMRRPGSPPTELTATATFTFCTSFMSWKSCQSA